MIPLMGLGPDGGHQNGIQASERIRHVSRRQRIVHRRIIGVFIIIFLGSIICFNSTEYLTGGFHSAFNKLKRRAMPGLSHLAQLKRQRNPGPAIKHQIDSDKKADHPQA